VIIDGHAHSCGEFYEAENIIDKLDELRVDKIILCPGVKNEPKGYNLPELAKKINNTDIMLGLNRIIKLISTPQTAANLEARNEYVHTLHSQYPERILQFYWADPSQEDIVHLHDKFCEWGFCGIKLHQCFHRFDSDSSGVDVIADFARDKEMPVFIHLYTSADARKFINTAKRHKETNFIIAHLIGLNTFIENAKELTNLYFDVSPTPLISPKRILQAIDSFGPSRILLGSDTPFGSENLGKNIHKIRQLDISENEKEHSCNKQK